MSKVNLVLLVSAVVFFRFEAFCQGWSTPYGTSYQVNVDAAGRNIVGDAANEPSLCLDPTNPNRIAVGWRQFNSVNNGFRQAGWAYSANGGVNWTFPGVLEGDLFRSDPVLASDANGIFYYLGVLTNAPTEENYHCDLFRSTNGGMTWESLGFAEGGDKEWMTIDTTTGPGRGNIYQAWSPWFNYAHDVNKIFSRSTDGGQSWMDAVLLPEYPFWGTLDIGLNGELYMLGWDGQIFWINRSTNAADSSSIPAFDLTVSVDLGGALIYGSTNVNPVGLLGQPWVAVDRSSGPTRGNVYALCSVGSNSERTDVMFARSTDGGQTWSAPQRLNDDPVGNNAYHWFGTLAVAPNGRVDACWNDTRSNTNNSFSELYYSFSFDGGLTWSTNHAVSPAFNHRLGYPVQQKMGDYIGMVSLNEAACIAYTATFNGEEDVYFLRVASARITVSVSRLGDVLRLSWNSTPGQRYCVEYKSSLEAPWSAAATLGCLTATNTVSSLDDRLVAGAGQRFYRVVLQP